MSARLNAPPLSKFVLGLQKLVLVAIKLILLEIFRVVLLRLQSGGGETTLPQFFFNSNKNCLDQAKVVNRCLWLPALTKKDYQNLLKCIRNPKLLQYFVEISISIKTHYLFCGSPSFSRSSLSSSALCVKLFMLKR